MIELSKIEIEKKIAELDKLLKERRDSILAIASSVLRSDISIHVFHGIIGSKITYLRMWQPINILPLRLFKQYGLKRCFSTMNLIGNIGIKKRSYREY